MNFAIFRGVCLNFPCAIHESSVCPRDILVLNDTFALNVASRIAWKFLAGEAVIDGGSCFTF